MHAWVRTTVALASLPAIALLITAADHVEAPGTKADTKGDITDVYAFHDAARDRLVTVIDFDGIKTPVAGQAGSFDRNVLFTLNIDRNGDSLPDIAIEIRFGSDGAGGTAVQVVGLPGASGTVSGAVESVLVSGQAKVFAGLRDDPFFFDFDGFKTTLQTGTLSFRNNVDFFAGTNLTAIVLEMPLSVVTVSGANPTLRIWATSARLAPPPVGVAAGARITSSPQL